MCVQHEKHDRLYKIRHSGAHVLAQAVLDMLNQPIKSKEYFESKYQSRKENQFLKNNYPLIKLKA